MSENMQHSGIPWDLINQAKEDNETRVIVPKTMRGSQKRPANDKIDVDDSIRRLMEPTGAIPKRFGQVLFASEASKPLGELKIPQNELLLGLRSNDGLYSKSKFTVFDEGSPVRPRADQKLSAEAKRRNMKFMATSTLIEDDGATAAHEAFNKARDFFEKQEVAVDSRTHLEKRREFKRKPKLHSLEEVNDYTPGLLPPRKVKQIVRNLSVPKETPHDVPPPVPEKIKVVHKSTRVTEEEIDNRGASSNRQDVQWSYLNDFMKYEEEKDKFRSFVPNYRKLNASVDQRQTVVHFLIRIGAHNCLPSYIIYQTVRIFDDMLQARQISLKHLQLVLLSALWIIMKKEYIAYRIPSAQKMANFSDGLYTAADICLCEKQIVHALDFKLTYADPFSTMVYFTMSMNSSVSMTLQQEEAIYYCGGYMLDLALLDEELITMSPILLAAAAVEIAMTLVMESKNSHYISCFPRWRPPYARIRLRCTDIADCQCILVRNIAESRLRVSKSWVVYKKYCKSRYNRVATELIEKINTIQPHEMLFIHQ